MKTYLETREVYQSIRKSVLSEVLNMLGSINIDALSKPESTIAEFKRYFSQLGEDFEIICKPSGPGCPEVLCLRHKHKCPRSVFQQGSRGYLVVKPGGCPLPYFVQLPTALVNYGAACGLPGRAKISADIGDEFKQIAIFAARRIAWVRALAAAQNG